ncbi:MAG: hypothetical protein ACOYLR_09730 [Chlorobium sp.]
MHIEPIAELDQILSLLAESGLPVSDISHAHLPLFNPMLASLPLSAIKSKQLLKRPPSTIGYFVHIIYSHPVSAALIFSIRIIGLSIKPCSYAKYC